MSLIVRRAAAAKGLLAAAAAVMFIAVLLLAGLTAYAGASAVAGMRAAVTAAEPAERSVLIRGAGGPGLPDRDRAVRQAYAGGLAGSPVTVRGALYGSGWAVDRPGGGATTDSSGVVYAAVTALDDLPGHATLVSGQWASGARSAALAEPVAGLLGVTTGDTLRLVDRRTDRVVAMTVSGVWRPRDAGDPFWQLVPEVFAGRAAQTATHGPVVVDRAAFDSVFPAGASAGWLVEPDLAGASLERVARTCEAAAAVAETLPERTGLGSSATITTGLPGLAGRLDRADLVRRSALVTPMLLLAVLGGYALTLVAALLGEARRAETALLRARGAARHQLAALAGAEALALMLPAGLLAPPLAVLLAGLVPSAGGLTVNPRLDATVWLIAALAVAGGILALTVPALRRARTYVAETATRSRIPMLRRAGLDLVVVALAVLGWVQLRQYRSQVGTEPGGAGFGIDPLLAAAPTLGVLTGAVLAIRLLPPIARLAASRLDRGVTRARLLGTWQAGRRSHAGPMVMLALAVAAATVSAGLAGTAQGSLGDQAVQQVGADLRLVETGGVAGPDRRAQLAALPGAGALLAGWRERLPLTAGAEPAELVALDAAAAGGVVQARDDATGGPPARLFERLVAARGVRRVATELRPGQIFVGGTPARTTAVFTDGRRVDLGVSHPGRPLTTTSSGPGLAGFLVEPEGPPQAEGPGVEDQRRIRWRITGQDGGWRAVGRTGLGVEAEADGSLQFAGRFAVTRLPLRGPVPVAVTPAVLTALNAKAGATSFLRLSGSGIPVTVVAVIERVPGTDGGAAVLADRTTLDSALFEGYGVAPRTSEWWVSGHPAGVRNVPGLQVLDQRELAAARDPFGAGARVALLLAAIGAVLLALAGIAVDARATARGRAGELAVLHTLGAGPRLLARALVVEQAFLAGIGTAAGLAVGLLVAGAMAPLLVLTPAAVRPVPEPVLHVDWLPAAGSVVLLVGVALALSAATAVSATRRLPAARLRLGADR